VKGFWYCGKGINLAQRQNNVQAVQSMVSYCKGKYKAYHGAEDGWDQIVASSAGESAPPSSFRVKARPTPCELAVQAVQENDPGQLSFADWEFILARANCSPANKAAADKVWRAIQQMEKYGEARLLIPVKVISATSSTIEAAISEENQQSNTADLHVELEKPLARPPAPASTIKITGVITKYTPDPFIFTMEKGALQR
jgi:hypothetical protein